MRPIPPLNVFECPLDGINLIEASAGTGKTWTICGLYLRLLLERGLTVQQILVVTFTNAATAELRERIRARIVELSAYLKMEAGTVADAFTVTLSEVLAERAGGDKQEIINRLQVALQSFDEASIFTIHGFCQRALADSPFSAGLPMKAELVEDDEDFLMEAVNDFWRRHVASDGVKPEFARFLHSRGDSPGKYAKLLKRHLAKPLARHLWPAGIDDPLIDASALNELYQRARTTWQATKPPIADWLVASLGSLNGITYKEAAVRAGAAQWERIFRDDDPLADLGEKTHLYCASVLMDKTKNKYTTPTHVFCTEIDEYLSLRRRLNASLALARLRLLRRLFDEAGSQLRELKLSRRVISFDDMLSNVHERLRNPEFPWLAPAIRARFPAALIDEFQDTDPLQFDIFRTIYAGGGSTVFVVGDPKQAIYSFRNADLHTYLRAKGWAAKEWSLTFNQRSSKPLLAAINGLFEANAGAFILPGLEYRHADLGPKRRQEFADRTEKRAPLQVWELPEDLGGPLAKSAARRAAVAATAAEIARLIQGGSDGRITLDRQPLRPRDVAVLVRTRALGSDVKRALASLRVGAVEITRSSIFSTVDAKDLEVVLTAILSPARDPLIRAALATDIFGCDAEDVAATSNVETLLMERIRQFTEYRDAWFEQGFGVMYRRLLVDQSVAGRMLSRIDGERRLTNLLHLGESLQQAAEMHTAPEALLRHLKRERDQGNPTDTAQLRLESDQNLVQIVTVHACKGLEYPIVFCPFLCDGGTKPGGPGLEGREYHDEDLQPVIDFRELGKEDPEFNRTKAIMRKEQAAETVRLLYVALTRAVHRCYLTAGAYASYKSLDESTHSMLNWLAAGQGLSLESWFDANATAAETLAAWRKLARSHAGHVDVSPLPDGTGTPLIDNATEATLSTPAAPAAVPSGWKLSSYSGLSYGAKSEHAAGDRDERALSSPFVPILPAGLAEDDVLRFPRGPIAGECIHAVFEEIDFQNSTNWESSIAAALVKHPQTLPGYPDQAQQKCLAGMLLNLVKEVTDATLIPGLQLRSIPLRRRLTELEFTFPVPRLSAGEFNSLLKRLGYDSPALQFARWEGYLRGFIDLVFEHQGRFFILDWKSNHLGYEAANYAAEPLARTMTEHGYHLQYLLYTIALDRYLRLRIQNYRYETHFGGVLYLFVRGIRSTWGGTTDSHPGVYFHRPAFDTVRMLNQIVGESARKARAT